jgi:plasmid stability protein
LLVRAILTAERAPETLRDLAQIAASAGMELQGDETSGQLTLVTDQIKKAQLYP